MKDLPLVLLSIASLLSASTASAAEAAAAQPPPHVIGNSQLRVLPKNAHGREYQLHVGLPESYAKATDRRYPVVYVTDGYWDFEKLAAIRGTRLCRSSSS
jgi:hypothetical protein